MIRISILTLAALCFSLTTQADNHGFDNFIEVELTVSTITINDAGMVITYESMAGKYGLVHATRNMVSTNDANSKGYFTGDYPSPLDKHTICSQIPFRGFTKCA